MGKNASNATSPLNQSPYIPSKLSSPTNTQDDQEEVDYMGLLSKDQLMELETGNEAILLESQTTTDQVRQATQSIQEISNLQAQLAHHLGKNYESFTFYLLHD